MRLLLDNVLAILLFLMDAKMLKVFVSARSVMMNHILQQKGQTATSCMLAFIGHLRDASVHLGGTVPVQRGLSFLHMQNSKRILLDKLWAEEVRFECQVSCV